MCLAGCGRGYPETAVVTGKVTYKGQPVPAGRVCFWPKEGRPAMGEIGSDGNYRLTSFSQGDGAIVGEHRVSITATRAHFPDGTKAGAGDVGWAGQPVVEWLVPQRYERPETSGLTTAVRAGKNTIDFDLPAER
jgi:hypothetical protein